MLLVIGVWWLSLTTCLFMSFGAAVIERDSKIAKNCVYPYLGTQLTIIWGATLSEARYVRYGTCMHLC